MLTDPRAWLDLAERYKLPGLGQRRLGPEGLWQALDSVVGHSATTVEEIGRSLEGRPVHCLRWGSGAVEVLLWSQMHGDESTTTRAMADLLHVLTEENPGRDAMARALTLRWIPQLNPDGAHLHQRENAAGIDLNRDAERQVSPEAKALEAVWQAHPAAFGFNLHDQDVRRTAGPEGLQVALAFLAPPADPAVATGPAQVRASRLASVMAEAATVLVPWRVARWADDRYDPRAFGDRIQSLGTSTVLLECGALPGDPAKDRLRSVTMAVIATALGTIVDGVHDGVESGAYDALPANTLVEHDVHLVGGMLWRSDGPSIRADLALLYDDPMAHTGLRLAEVGDLGQARAIETIDTSGSLLVLTGTETEPNVLRPGMAVEVAVHRGEKTGPCVAVFPPRR